MALGGFFLLTLFASPRAAAATPTPTATVTATPTLLPTATFTPLPTVTATPIFDMGRLAKPKTGNPPTQLDEGRLIYWGVCMACHGDKGQGLTDEWRYGAFGEDNNCWASKCHAPNHPPQGFEFPRIVPALVGPGTLVSYVNAEQLYEYTKASMPRWNPGSLTPERAWAVTAYLLAMNAKLPTGVILGASNASFIPVQYAVAAPSMEIPWKLLLAGTFVLAAIIIGAQALGEGRKRQRPNFILHLHPPTIPALQARWRYTLGAGGLAVFLCLVLLGTGLLELYYYTPSPERAAQSVQEITYLVPYGGLVRGLHFWAAQALAVIASIHLLRVLLTGAYRKPRRFNYLLGMGLLVIILLLDFTGYVLRWDEGVRWALIAGTNLLASVPAIGTQLVTFVSGGVEPGPGLLVRYYAWHIFGLAAFGAFLLIWHLFRVRRDGGISAPPRVGQLVNPPHAPVEQMGNPPNIKAAQIDNPPTAEIPPEAPVRSASFLNRVLSRVRRTDKGKATGTPADAGEIAKLPTRISRNELLRREVIAILLVGGILILLATFLPAPIARPIDPSIASTVEPRAPWFFLWVQELLKLGDPFLLGVLTPVLLLVFLAALPYIFPRLAESELGRWFPHSGRVIQIIAILIALAIVTLTVLALTT